jgi:aspartyl-tRNA(Asn)/glutamyl-tRNA(Gln) amidotransferase subunit C
MIVLRPVLLRAGKFLAGSGPQNRPGGSGAGFLTSFGGEIIQPGGFLLVHTSSLQYIIKVGIRKISPRPVNRPGRMAGGLTPAAAGGADARRDREKFMALSREEVLHVANLARLSLEPAEIELFTRQLNDILAYVEKLQELDTEGVPPLAHVIPVFNVFRQDAVREGLARQTALDNAPAHEEGAFLVPRVI